MKTKETQKETVEMRTDDAALILSPDGDLRLVLPPMGEEETVPDHVANVAACAIAMKKPVLMQYLLESVYGDDDDED